MRRLLTSSWLQAFLAQRNCWRSDPTLRLLTAVWSRTLRFLMRWNLMNLRHLRVKRDQKRPFSIMQDNLDLIQLIDPDPQICHYSEYVPHWICIVMVTWCWWLYVSVPIWHAVILYMSIRSWSGSAPHHTSREITVPESFSPDLPTVFWNLSQNVAGCPFSPVFPRSSLTN